MMFAKMALRNMINRKQRTFLTVLAIGISVASAVLLISVAIGMNNDNTGVFEKQTDFWIIPSGSSVLDPVTNSEKTLLGNVHQRTETLRSYPDIKGVTPVLNKALYAGKNVPKVVLGVGLIPDGSLFIPDNALTSGDPYYYNKEMTREVAINSQLSKLLGVKHGDYIYLGPSASSLINSTPFKIVSIVDSIEFSNAPVAILHLSELQELTGNLIGDRADLILAEGNGLQALLQSHFPDAIVLSESEFYARSITEDKRILATSVAVIIVVLVMGILFISSSMIFSVNEKQKEFAIMRAMGISDRSIMKIVLYESIMISVVGGFTGLILGYLGKYILNSAAVSSFQVSIISSTNPYILLMAFATAVLAGVISGIVPALMGKQDNIARILGN